MHVFLSICLKTAIWLFLSFFGTRSGFFGEDRSATLSRAIRKDKSVHTAAFQARR